MAFVSRKQGKEEKRAKEQKCGGTMDAADHSGVESEAWEELCGRKEDLSGKAEE